MKKFASLLLTALLMLAGTAPAKASVTFTDEPQRWAGEAVASWINLQIGGSIKSGSSYEVSVSATIPAEYACDVRLLYWSTSVGYAAYVAEASGSVTASSGSQISGQPGSTIQWTANFACHNSTRTISHSYVSSTATITFESPLGTPSNVSIFPQGGGAAFATWGVADGASSYLVTATPGGQTCTSTQNYCTVTGLTNGETYTFEVKAISGNSFTVASSGLILMRQPVNVAVALSGGTWKVGETVSAQVAIQGQGGVAITWYRCDQVVGAMPTAPVGCASVASGTSTSYTLTSGDIGKYITAHVFVNNTDPQGQMTASNTNAVLASNAVAPAPVADPDGKPTIVSIPDRIVPISGGTEIVITGTGLAGVTSVTIGGIPTDVVSKTDTSITVKVPVSGKTGAADVVITNAKGSVTEKGALVYTTAPVTKITKTKLITGFTATQKTLTAAQKSAVKALISANPTLTQLTCEAKTTGVAINSAELTKAKSLATATCAYATTVKKTLLVGVSANQSLPKAKASRTVLLTLKN